MSLGAPALGAVLAVAIANGGVPMPSARGGILRGVQPSYVTDDRVILCKSAPSIENTYEIRLTLYFAVERERKAFELRVPKGAAIDKGLTKLIERFGGRVSRQDCDEFTVSFTHFHPDGKEGDSWVLGDRVAWETLVSSLKSSWLRKELRPGASFSGQALQRLKQELSGEVVHQRNIDEESVQEALQGLVRECEAAGGYVRVQ